MAQGRSRACCQMNQGSLGLLPPIFSWVVFNSVWPQNSNNLGLCQINRENTKRETRAFTPLHLQQLSAPGPSQSSRLRGWPRRVWLRSLCCSPLEQLLVGFQAAPNPLLSSSSLKLCAPSPEPPQQAFAGSISLSWHSLWRGTMSPMPTQPAKPRQSQAEGHPPWLAGRSHVAPNPYRHTGLLCKSRSLPLLRGDLWTIFRFCTMLLGGSSSLWHTINKSTQFSSLRLCRQNWSHLELLVFLFLLRNVSVLQRQ